MDVGLTFAELLVRRSVGEPIEAGELWERDHPDPDDAECCDAAEYDGAGRADDLSENAGLEGTEFI
jgi:hypothetical protein